MKTKSKDALWLNTLNEKIHTQLENTNLTADTLAQQMNLSRRQLFRKVKALTGQTPNEYINSIRYQKAKEYLEHYTYQTVADTARAVGFRDAGYFARQFKERYGMLPSEV